MDHFADHWNIIDSISAKRKSWKPVSCSGSRICTHELDQRDNCNDDMTRPCRKERLTSFQLSLLAPGWPELKFELYGTI